VPLSKDSNGNKHDDAGVEEAEGRPFQDLVGFTPQEMTC